MEQLQIDTSNPQFKNALDLVQHTNQSLFLTGKAGTGKSTFLKYICSTTKKNYVVLAPTGIAAINAGGSTLHSFFHLPFSPLVPDDSRFQGRRIREFLKYNKEQIKLLKQLDLIIIDEISMVRADTIDFIDRILRTYSGNSRLPFGGKQLLFVGDVFQLEPVVTRDERDILQRFYDTPHFFSARVFHQIQLVSIELTKVYRQTDTAFITVLDHIRNNTATAQDLQLLNTCVGQDNSSPDTLSITLAARRDVVDHINQHSLSDLPGDPTIFPGDIQGEFPDTMLPTLLDLELKVGAQIIFIKNDQDHRWVNGTIGMITGIDDEGRYLYIHTDDGNDYDVERARWANVRYSYNEQEHKIEEQEFGTFTQFPVRLAWAITIHKSQGLTFNRVTIDFTGGVFAGGQTYVALSRCRSLDGLQLTNPISPSDVFVNPTITQFSKQFNSPQALQQALKRATADIEYADAARAFDSGDFGACLEHFFLAIHARYDIERNYARRYLRRKLSIITILRQKIEQLQQQLANKDEQLKQMQSTLNDYASEYYALAQECIDLNETQAAITNLDKAIRMNPRYTDAFVAKAQLLLRSGKLRQALSAANSALDIQPLHFKAIYTRGKTNFAMQNYDLALNDLLRCTSLNKENISSHQLLGDIYSALGDEESAAIQWAIADRLKKKKNK